MSATEEALASRSTVLKASAVAFVAASVVLVTLVLPVEYGVDPLGTGRALGFTAIADPQAEPVAPPEVGMEYVPTQHGAAAAYGAAFSFWAWLRMDKSAWLVFPRAALACIVRLAIDARR